MLKIQAQQIQALQSIKINPTTIEATAKECLKQFSDDFYDHYLKEKQPIDDYVQESVHRYRIKEQNPLRVKQINDDTQKDVSQLSNLIQKYKAEKKQGSSYFNGLRNQNTEDFNAQNGNFQNSEVSPWSVSQNDTQFYRNSFKPVKSLKKGIKQFEVSHSMPHKEKKIRLLNKSNLKETKILKNKQLIYPESENRQKTQDYCETKKAKKKQNYVVEDKQNYPVIELITICGKHKHKQSILIDQETRECQNKSVMSNITNVCHKNSQDAPGIHTKSDCSKKSLTEDLFDHKNGDFWDPLLEKISLPTNNIQNTKQSKTYNISAGAKSSVIGNKIENMYRRYSELRNFGNNTNSCEKIKKEILSNIEKESVSNFAYYPNNLKSQSAANCNKLLLQPNKSKNGYCKRSQQYQQFKNKIKRNISMKKSTNISNLQHTDSKNSIKNIQRYLITHKANTSSVHCNRNKSKSLCEDITGNNRKQSLKNLLYYQKSKTSNIKACKNYIQSYQTDHPLNKHLYEKYKIMIASKK